MNKKGAPRKRAKMWKGTMAEWFYTLVDGGGAKSQAAQNVRQNITRSMGDSPNVIQCCSFELSF